MLFTLFCCVGWLRFDIASFYTGTSLHSLEHPFKKEMSGPGDIFAYRAFNSYYIPHLTYEFKL